MPRVLITGFCAVPGPTRAGVQLRHVVRALSSDHTVDLLVTRGADQAYVERQGNVRILRVPVQGTDLRSQVQSFQRALRRQLDGADYDVVHCRDGWSCRTVLDGRATFDYAVVYDLTRSPWVDGAVDPELAAELDRDADLCISDADLVLVPTEPARRHAAARTRPDKVVVSPPGVDVDRFDWDDEPSGDPPRVLYAGALEPGRGVRTLLRAMVDVVKGVPARLVLVGPLAPGFDHPLAAAIRDLGLGDRVDVEPPVDHDAMPRALAAATVCVVPAAPDLVPRATALYPTKVLEYMACRRAVVAPRRGTVAMLIDHGRDGMLFQPAEPGDMARKILRLLQDAELRTRMAQHGYERVRREFTASGARRAIRLAYQRLGERPQFCARFLQSATGSGAQQPRARSSSDLAVIDDDFEATVFEAPRSHGDAHPHADAESNDSLPSLKSALDALDADARTGDTPVTEEREIHGDETAERPLPPPRGRPGKWFGVDSGAFTTLTAELSDGWVVAGQRPPQRDDDDDEGTPVDVSVEAVLMPSDGPPSSFVAGEIDVPTPSPELTELIEADGAFTAASSLLGPWAGDRGSGDVGRPK